jgi:hypothetical protein
MKVPFYGHVKQYHAIKAEIDSNIERVLESGLEIAVAAQIISLQRIPSNQTSWLRDFFLGANAGSNPSRAAKIFLSIPDT